MRTRKLPPEGAVLEFAVVGGVSNAYPRVSVLCLDHQPSAELNLQK